MRSQLEFELWLTVKSKKGSIVKIAKRRPSVAILCLAISLGLMAFSASAAQAATWMVNGTNVVSDLAVGITAKAEKDISLLSTISGVKFTLLCENLEFRNAVMHAGGLATAEFLWNGCRVFLGEKESTACKPHEPVDLTEKAKGEKEEGKDDEEMETSATIELGEECAVGSKLPLSGIYWIEDCENKWETEQLVHLVQEAMGVALTLGGLKLGANAAFIDGSINLEVNDGGPKKFSALF